MSSGAADFMLRTSHYVQDLERRVQEFDEQRAQLARQLEDMEGKLGKMADGYEALERRFRSLAETNPPAANSQPPAAPPSAATPPAASNGAQQGEL
jgi:hypothetical protein